MPVFSFEVAFPTSPSRPVPVVVAPGALRRLVAELPAMFPGHVPVVVSDDRVFPLHGRRVADGLRQEGLPCASLVFPAGETSKTRETKAVLEDRLAELGAGRDAVLVAVGGGVTGDLAGFVAATWHRGVPVVQAPTSLLAMADSALGGKTAVNLPGAKNLIGAYHRPAALFADLDTLATLPDRELRGGLAEVVKSAVLSGEREFAELEEDVPALDRRDPAALERAVRLGLTFKARVVSADEREHGERAILNFGHTVAHALEAAAGWELLHGEAVAIGLVAEARLAALRFGFPERDVERIRSLLESLRLPVAVPAGIDGRSALRAAERDKKNRGGELRVSVPDGIGIPPSGDGVLRRVSREDFVAVITRAD